LVGNPQGKKHEAGLRVDGVKHEDTSHRNKIRNRWTEWAYDRVLRQGFVSRAMNFQAAHEDYFYTLLSKNQLSNEESVSYRVSKKQKKRLVSLT